MSIILNDNLKVSAPKPSDARYLTPQLTPWIWENIEAGIPAGERHLGLTVLVASGSHVPGEYWFKNATASVATDLVLKAAATGGMSAPIYTQPPLTNNGNTTLTALLDEYCGLSGAGVYDSFTIILPNLTTTAVVGQRKIIQPGAAISRLKIQVNANTVLYDGGYAVVGGAALEFHCVSVSGATPVWKRVDAYRAAGLPPEPYYRYGQRSWLDVDEAENGIPVAHRYPGMTVLVSGAEYWWRDGTANGLLIVKAGGSGGTGGVYTGKSPTNVKVGALEAKTPIAGKTWVQVVEMMTNTYLAPYLYQFGADGFYNGHVLEVGSAWPASVTYRWQVANEENVKPGSVTLWFLTFDGDSVPMKTGMNGDARSAVVASASMPWGDPVSLSGKQFYVSALANDGTYLESPPFIVYGVYPWVWGTKDGGTRPENDQALFDTGTRVTQFSNGTVTAPFASTANHWIWFAIPLDGGHTKSRWYVDALNNGVIGGEPDPGGNLFPSDDLLWASGPLWDGSLVAYMVYISNYQTGVQSTMELRNS